MGEIDLSDTSIVNYHPNKYYRTGGTLDAAVINYDAYDFIARTNGLINVSTNTGRILRVQIYGGFPSGSTYLRSIEVIGNRLANGEVTAGEVVTITVTNTNDLSYGPTNFSVKEERPTGRFTMPGLALPDIDEGNPYSDNLVHITHSASPNLSEFVIYKQCKYEDGSKYIGTTFYNKKEVAKNADVWHLGDVNLYSRDDQIFTRVPNTQFVLYGEWESAVQEQGKPDFMGGNAHGDENYTDFVAILDGQLLSTESNYYASGRKLTILCNSIFNRVGAPEDPVAEHSKYYEIDVTGMVVTQRVKWQQSITCDKSYMTMFPVARKIDNDYVSRKAIRDNTYELEDLSEGHTRVWSKNTNEVTIFNDGLGHQFSAKIDIITPSNLPNSDMFISESISPGYNKLYYDYCGNNYVTSVDEEWRIKTKFNYDYSGFATE